MNDFRKTLRGSFENFPSSVQLYENSEHSSLQRPNEPASRREPERVEFQNFIDNTYKSKRQQNTVGKVDFMKYSVGTRGGRRFECLFYAVVNVSLNVSVKEEDENLDSIFKTHFPRRLAGGLT